MLNAAKLYKASEIKSVIVPSPVYVEGVDFIEGVPIHYLGSEEEKFAEGIIKMCGQTKFPKTVHLFKGTVHGQNIFATGDKDELISLIISYIKGDGKKKGMAG